LFVPLPCQPAGPLRTPTQSPQQFTYVALVVAHPELVLDQVCNSRTSPQGRLESAGLGAAQSQLFELLELNRIELRPTPGGTGFGECGLTVLAILPYPAHDGLAGEVQASRTSL